MSKKRFDENRGKRNKPRRGDKGIKVHQLLLDNPRMSSKEIERLVNRS